MYKIKAVLYAGVIVLLNWPCKDGAIKEKLGDCFFFSVREQRPLRKLKHCLKETFVLYKGGNIAPYPKV